MGKSVFPGFSSVSWEFFHSSFWSGRKHPGIREMSPQLAIYRSLWSAGNDTKFGCSALPWVTWLAVSSPLGPQHSTQPSLPYSSRQGCYCPGIHVRSGVQVPSAITSEYYFPFCNKHLFAESPWSASHCFALLSDCLFLPISKSVLILKTSTFRKVVRLI